jgi:integrase
MFAREVRKKIEALEDADVNKMFNYLKDLETETNRQEVIRLRNLVILQLLVYTGVRVGELVNIKIDDIGEQMQIIGK